MILILIVCLTISFTFSNDISLITLVSPDNTSSIMYTNGKIQPMFSDKSQKYNCAMSQLYIYQQTYAQLLSNTHYSVIINGTGNYSINYKTQHNNFKPLITPTTCTNDCILTIINNCPNPFNNHNYFDEISLFISNIPVISYRVNCDQQFSPSSIFQWGLLVLTILATILIYASSHFSKSYAYDGFGVTLGYGILIGVISISMILGVLAVFFVHEINIIIDVISWVAGCISVAVCFNQIFFMLGLKMLNKPLFSIDSILFRYFRPIQVISILLGIIMTCAWWFTSKNWIINDILSACIIVAIVKFFKFTSMKIATIYFGVVVVCQMIIVVLILIYEGQFYDNVFLNYFNNPLEFQFPSITESLYIKCSWLPVTQIIFPAVFMSYMKRFDDSRQGKVYIIVSSISFFVGSVIWIIANIFSSMAIPLGLCTQPFLLISTVLFSLKRNEIKVIWYGRFYDMDYKDRKSFKQQMRKTADTNEQQVQIQLGQKVLVGLKIDEQSQLQSTMRKSTMRKTTLRKTNFIISFNKQK